MTTILLIIQIVIVLCLIGLVLLQKTGTDSLAGLSGGGLGAFSSKATSNFLSKLTVAFAIAFFCNCVLIAKIVNAQHKEKASILNGVESIDTGITPSSPDTNKAIKTPGFAE